MQITSAAAYLSLLTGATVSLGEVELIDLLPGYTLGLMAGLSADGSTLAVDMFVNESIRYDAYAWRDGAWSSLPRANDFNQWQGISADGRTTLSVSSRWGTDAELFRMRDGVREPIRDGIGQNQVLATLTRDGNTVFYSTRSDGTGRVEMYSYSPNMFGWSTPLGTLSDRYDRPRGMLAGHRDNQFVINATLSFDVNGVGGTTRAVIFDDGQLTEIGTLGSEPILHSWATDMTGDGTIIVGTERGRELGSDDDEYRSWIHQDGVTSQILIPGFDRLGIWAISDDAKSMVGSARSSDGDLGWYLFANGRATSATELLAREGIMISDGQSVGLSDISADGRVVSGVISLGQGDLFGPRYTLFTITVPAPASLTLMIGLTHLARRRR